MDTWLDDLLVVLGLSGLAGWEGWAGLFSPRRLRRLAWVALALAVTAGCGLAGALMGTVWPLALAGPGLALLAGAAWLGRGRRAG